MENGIILIDKDEKILFVNQTAQIKLKKTFKEVKGKKINEIINFDKIHDVLNEGINFSQICINLEEEATYLNISAIEMNRNIIGALIVFSEKHDSIDYIDTLKLSNSISRELERLLNSSFDEIIVSDPQGNILQISAFYGRLYNEDNSDLVGKNISELLQKGMFSPSVILKVIKENKRISITQETNSGRILVVTGYPIYDENENLVSIISIAKDITEFLLRAKMWNAKKAIEKSYYQLEAFKQNETKTNKFSYKSKSMEEIMVIADNVAKVDSNVLITGESGVGKSVLAEYIHNMSGRSNELFVNINCGAIPESLLESELFGYEKGAFTGANTKGKVGKIDLANKGTLFLDEISELPLAMQVKILKVIQEKQYTRVGGTETLTSDFRLITATNKDLQELVRKGKFRDDLFYRLNVIPILIPPLRKRKEDIILLITQFWEKLNHKYGTNRKIDKEVYDLLLDHSWPGNVRELENCIERIMVTVNKNHIKAEDLPPALLGRDFHIENPQILSLKNALDNTEKELILKAYKQYKNTYKVAEILGVSQSTIVRKLKKYGCSDIQE
jgi:TyrR family helix-turn-helix protein/PAS domain S-box-containing protein